MGKSTIEWSFSMAMFNYQRGSDGGMMMDENLETLGQKPKMWDFFPATGAEKEALQNFFWILLKLNLGRIVATTWGNHGD